MRQSNVSVRRDSRSFWLSEFSFLFIVPSTSPFYGYHQNEHRFLKIYFYNPLFIRRAANLLQNGAILNKIHQPHESHLPYLLQFFIDFNLYGMSFLHVPAEVVRYRRRPSRRNTQSNGKFINDHSLHNSVSYWQSAFSCFICVRNVQKVKDWTAKCIPLSAHRCQNVKLIFPLLTFWIAWKYSTNQVDVTPIPA